MSYQLGNLQKIFTRISYSTSPSSAFSDLLDFFLAPYRFHETGEELQQVLTRLQAHERKDLYLEFLQELGNLSEGFRDPLGEFYMMEISHGHMGQYFTPEPIADCMAQMTIGGEARAGQRILDPACGSGRFILAAAKINRTLHFFGADLDLTCCKMSVANMLLNSLCGEIAHMDSLRNDFYRGYHLFTKLVDGYHYPYFIEFTNPEESYIWLHPTKQAEPFVPQPSPTTRPGTQGTLF
jgi:type I restriction-modification system DNA methylase subunit